MPENAIDRLKAREAEAEEMLSRIDKKIMTDEKIRVENDRLVITPLEGEEIPPSAVQLAKAINQRLPRVDLSEILIEVDRWVNFSQFFEHAGGREFTGKDLQRDIYSSILAQACNIGYAKTAQMTETSFNQLIWCTNWFLRDETLTLAIDALVNYQYCQPLSRYWGGGTLSSSDGQRFPVSGKIRNARALPRYFGYGKGITFYSWTSDQFSQFGSKVIPSTVRDATYVLDALLDNETELQLLEHITDTAGYTETVFALFDLLGMIFSPRIRDIGDQLLYRVDRSKKYPNLGSRVKGIINRGLIIQHLDDILRVAGSLKKGWVTASLFINKLKSYPRKSSLALAIQEYGRLIKTIFISRYLDSEEYRRKIMIQLNKGEALHSLRRFLFFANEGKIRRKQETEQEHQASCLTLLTNAVITWNTVYIKAVIDQLTEEGFPINDSDIRHVSPARYEHINQYGTYRFGFDNELGNNLRPLR